MYSFQVYFDPSLLKGVDTNHAFYVKGEPVTVGFLKECLNENRNVIEFIDDWLVKKIFTLSYQESLTFPAVLKDAISIYHREQNEYRSQQQ